MNEHMMSQMREIQARVQARREIQARVQARREIQARVQARRQEQASADETPVYADEKAPAPNEDGYGCCGDALPDAPDIYERNKQRLFELIYELRQAGVDVKTAAEMAAGFVLAHR